MPSSRDRRGAARLIPAALAVIAALVALVVLLRARGSTPKAPTSAPEASLPAKDRSPGATPHLPAASPRSEDHADLFAPDEAPGAQPIALYDGPDGPPPYPPGSQPLTEGVDPATTIPEDNPVDEDDPLGMRAILGPRLDVVHPPDPLVIDLQVIDRKGQRLAVGAPYVRFRGERASPEGPWFRAAMRDDGRGADLAAGDRRYTATYTPDADARRELSGYRVFVEVGFEAPRGLGRRLYATSMMYTPLPGAHLNGQFSERIVDGSLVVDVGVTVEDPGRYKVIASLYGPDGETAIVFAQHAAELPRGRQSLPLTFFGKILHDRAIDGPYVLRYMMLFQEFPERGVYHPGVTLDPAHRTRPYPAAEFSPDPYVPPPSDIEEVTADHPSQRDTPPPIFGAEDR